MPAARARPVSRVKGGRSRIFGTTTADSSGHSASARSSSNHSLAGALILGVLENGLTLLDVSSYYQQIVMGLIVILAVALDQHTAKGAAAKGRAPQ